MAARKRTVSGDTEVWRWHEDDSDNDNNDGFYLDFAATKDSDNENNDGFYLETLLPPRKDIETNSSRRCLSKILLSIEAEAIQIVLLFYKMFHVQS